MWTTLNFEGRSKRRARDICKWTLDIECQRDWPIGLGATLGGGPKIKRNIFPVSGIFPGEAESVILLDFECTLNPQNLIKIVGAIFEKIKFLNFFLIWTNLNFKSRSKKKSLAIFAREPNMSNLNEIGQLV